MEVPILLAVSPLAAMRSAPPITTSASPRPRRGGARLAGDHRAVLVLLEGRAHHAERGAVAAGRQGAGIAVRHDARPARNQPGAVPADRPVGGQVFLEYR